MKQLGVIAAGHEETVNAAEQILRAGGNAFDAVIAAHFAACVAEPVLASLGGGGYLLAHTAQRETRVFDFFVQTPMRKLTKDQDFYPIQANFGTATQEFHIGTASIATPGSVKGMFEIHRHLGSMPMLDLVAPAIALAKQGVVLNRFQAYIFEIVAPIFTATPQAKRYFASRKDPETLAKEGERIRQPELADLLEALAHEGDALFYRGEVAARLDEMCRSRGGHLTRQDMQEYEVRMRKPLHERYQQADFVTNPPPSSGGILIAFALEMLNSAGLHRYEHGSYEHLALLSETMLQTSKARVDARFREGQYRLEQVFDAGLLEQYRTQILRRAEALRGTTHMSVMDAKGNVASLTVSNGEGCGYMVPGAGFMPNNMLGEEDLNPGRFHRWQTDQRMTSMMAPSLLFTKEQGVIALGSGGSNRLRTAILQVLVNLLDFGLGVEDAVRRPRIHLENSVFNIEAGYRQEVVERLASEYRDFHAWPERNLYFGGAHTIARDKKGFCGAGDPRRGGVAKIL